MKYIKYFAVIVTVCVISCKSTYKDNRNPQFKNNPFKILDSLENTRRKTNFSISPVKDWHSLYNPGTVTYSLRNRDYNKYQTTLTIYNTPIKKRFASKKVVIEDYLDYHILLKKRYFKNFKYKVIKAKHKLYNDIIILNFAENNGSNQIKEKSLFLFVYKKKGYTIEFRANPKDFKSEFPQVEKMINSFRITE